MVSSITNTILKYEKIYPSIFIFLLSFAIILWFRGAVGIIDIVFIRKNKIQYYLLCIAIACFIIYIHGFGMDIIFDLNSKRKMSNNKRYDENDIHNIAKVSAVHVLRAH